MIHITDISEHRTGFCFLEMTFSMIYSIWHIVIYSILHPEDNAHWMDYHSGRY